MREFFIDEDETNFEPSCESFLNQLTKAEAFSLFQKCLEKEKDERVKKIIDIRYDGLHNKLTPWRVISKDLSMSIQGCINIHNRFIEKVKKHIKNV